MLFKYVFHISEGYCVKDSFVNEVTSTNTPPTVMFHLRQCQEQHGCSAKIKQIEKINCYNCGKECWFLWNRQNTGANEEKKQRELKTENLTDFYRHVSFSCKKKGGK